MHAKPRERNVRGMRVRAGEAPRVGAYEREAFVNDAESEKIAHVRDSCTMWTLIFLLDGLWFSLRSFFSSSLCVRISLGNAVGCLCRVFLLLYALVGIISQQLDFTLLMLSYAIALAKIITPLAFAVICDWCLVDNPVFN